MWYSVLISFISLIMRANVCLSLFVSPPIKGQTHQLSSFITYSTIEILCFIQYFITHRYENISHGFVVEVNLNVTAVEQSCTFSVQLAIYIPFSIFII